VPPSPTPPAPGASRPGDSAAGASSVRGDGPGPPPHGAAAARPPGVVVALLVVAVAVAAFWVLRGRALPGADAVADALRDRGRVLLVGAPELARVASGRTTMVALDAVPGARAALEGRDAAALVSALRAASVSWLLVDARGASEEGTLADALRRARPVEGLRAVTLSPLAHVYTLSEPVGVEPHVGAALARVSREMLMGARAPRLASFPEAVRTPRAAGEVMVLIRQHGRPRLWRSARGASIARGLVLAVEHARSRWAERERALGGPIEDVLPGCAVELALLEEDGTLGERSAAFADRVVTPEHGVGYEKKGSWRYHLPEQVHRDGPLGGSEAFARLFDEFGVRRAEGFARRDLRLYRLRVIPIGASPPGSPMAPAPDRRDAGVEPSGRPGADAGALVTGGAPSPDGGTSRAPRPSPEAGAASGSGPAPAAGGSPGNAAPSGR
jgi:hypothetical protein